MMSKFPNSLIFSALLAMGGPMATAQSGAPKSQTGGAKVRAARAASGAQTSAPKTSEKPASVTVRPNCEVTGPTFTLGEIAEIRSEDAALAAQLAGIEIGASPLPGLSRLINPGDI